MDTKTNNYGHKLVDMCKNIGLIIVNGRCGKDAHIGKLTCKDASLIDYVLASPRIITCIYDFDILPFNECLSDVHCPLHIILKSDKDSSLQNVPASVIDGNLIRPKWKDEFKSLFTENIDLDSIETIQLHINNLQQQEDINQYDVDETYKMITNVLNLSAIACGSVSPCRPKKKLSTRRKSNLWWNDDCENYRKEFNIARKLNIQHKTEQTNLMRKQASKRYKKLIKKNINNYHKDLNHKIRVLKSKNPKDFWKIINSDKDKESIVSKISSDMFAEHFESLNVLDDKDDSFDIPSLTSINNSPLNDLITNNEIDTCINKLKNNKACGYDRIINEFIKCSATSMSNLYKTFFNLVLTTGIVPEDWVIGIIKPIYKNKGSRLDTDNYRGITLLSCMGKLFTFILNERLKLFLEYNKILCEEQAGFRKGYSTSDHIFTLNFIIGLYLNKGKRLYGAFVDYRKAFDSIHRITLWKKLVSYNIDGYFFKVIHNMYSMAKSCVKNGSVISRFFDCNSGVRQGENLSPLLFALFLNDLNTYLSTHYAGLTSWCKDMNEKLPDDELDIFRKLCILLYADDTIILAESPHQLQKALDGMAEYCRKNKLKVNERKTKIVVFF
jgi:hypothetical protein